MIARADTIVFTGVPSNATVQCVSDVPNGLVKVTEAIPYGVASSLLTGHSAGDAIVVGLQSVGNLGKLDLCGINMSSAPAFRSYMVSGGPCEVSTGDQVSSATGTTGVREGFQDRLASNPVVLTPVVDAFLTGDASVTITGFVVAQIVSLQGNGNSFTVTLKLLSLATSPANVTASSNCGSVTNLTFNESQRGLTTSCTNIFTRTWSATDTCGNSAIATQTIALADTTTPLLTCPATVIVNTAAGQCAASGVNLGSPTISDNCSGLTTTSSNAPGTYLKGTNTVVWTTADSCGNSTICTQTVIVVDNQPPVINFDGNIVTNTDEPGGIVITFTAAASDNCDGGLTANCLPASGSTFSAGATPVTCTATDSSGNLATRSFNVVVLNDLSFRILSLEPAGDDVLVTWTMPRSCSGVVQRADGITNVFSDVGLPVFVSGTGFATNNIPNVGGLTNVPAQFYRIRLLP